MEYIVISRHEDEPYLQGFHAEGLKKALAPGGEFEGYKILRDLPGSNIEEFPSRSVLIVHGEILVPKAKKTIVEYDL